MHELILMGTMLLKVNIFARNVASPPKKSVTAIQAVVEELTMFMNCLLCLKAFSPLFGRIVSSFQTPGGPTRLTCIILQVEMKLSILEYILLFN